MKKFITLFITFFIFSVSVFADISTYKSEVITVEDVLDDFIELLNGPMYAYGIVDYEVYKESDKQNYCFKTVTSDASYTGQYTNVKGKAVTLYFTNGYLTVRTYGGPTQYNVKSCFDLNTKKGLTDFYDLFNTCVKEASETSIKWLDKYGRLDKKKFENISRLSLLRGFTYVRFSTQSRNGFIWRDVAKENCYNYDTFNEEVLNAAHPYQIEQPDIVYNCLHKFYGYNLFGTDELLDASFDTSKEYAKKHKNEYIPVFQRQLRYVYYLSDNNYKELIVTYEKVIKGQDILDDADWLSGDKLKFNFDEKLEKLIETRK